MASEQARANARSRTHAPRTATRTPRTATRQHGRAKLRSKRLANGDTSLYLDIYHGRGRRSYEFLRLYLVGHRARDKATMDLAETIRARREIELASADYDVPIARGESIDVLAWLDDYFTRTAKRTRAQVMPQLRAFTGGFLASHEVTPRFIERFRDFLLARPKPHGKTGTLERTTVRNYLAFLRVPLREARRDGIIRSDPYRDVKLPAPEDVEPVHLSLDELRTLDRTPCSVPEVKRAFLFACFAGLRISDVRALTWAHFSRVGDGSHSDETRLAFKQQKTRKVEHVPVSREALRYLGLPSGSTMPASARPADPCFAMPSDKTITRALRRWARAAGITKHLTFHTSRHTFATLALEYGGDITTVQKLLGHRTLATTLRYAKVVDRSKRDAVEKMPTIDDT